MKKFINTIVLLIAFAILFSGLSAEAKSDKKTQTKTNAAEKTVVKTDDGTDLSSIGFHKRSDLTPEMEIKKIFQDYETYTNTKNLSGFMGLHDSSYRSADGYDKKRLEEIAVQSWKEYPDVKYEVKILSINIDIDNATVITNERLSGITNTKLDYLSGTGNIDSDSTAVYYLQRFSNEWRIISDFIINEKTYMRFGVAKYIPMRLDAPSIAAPNEDYTAIIKMSIPKDYVALVSLTNEPITFPAEKSTEVFRGMKSSGVRERILKTNDGSKNENAVASIAIAQPDINNDMINISIAGIAFLSSRVNVVKHKLLDEQSKVAVSETVKELIKESVKN